MKIAYSLPKKSLANEELVKEFPDWTAEKILTKTGIASRHVCGPGESALTLAEDAARQLFAGGVAPTEIDFILYCTQSPEYRLPSTACLLQTRLGLRTDIGALDYDLGCSGFAYGLALAKGLVTGALAKRVLLITAETYTKYIGKEDRSTRTIFGDGAAATLVDEAAATRLGAFVFGTNGAGAEKLICREDGRLFMDGPEIFNFTLDIVPGAMEKMLAANGLGREDIDLYVFHQANKFMLDTIRKVNLLPRDRFYVNLTDTGNTVSSTIPIALKRAEAEGRLKPGMKVMVLGFGVGLSWCGTIINW